MALAQELAGGSGCSGGGRAAEMASAGENSRPGCPARHPAGCRSRGNSLHRPIYFCTGFLPWHRHRVGHPAGQAGRLFSPPAAGPDPQPGPPEPNRPSAAASAKKSPPRRQWPPARRLLRPCLPPGKLMCMKGGVDGCGAAGDRRSAAEPEGEWLREAQLLSWVWKWIGRPTSSKVQPESLDRMLPTRKILNPRCPRWKAFVPAIPAEDRGNQQN